MITLVPLRRQAPVFSQKALHGTGVVGGAFTEWVHHYNGCCTCQIDDWYMPTSATSFCKEGRHLFSMWEHATTTTRRIF